MSGVNRNSKSEESGKSEPGGEETRKTDQHLTLWTRHNHSVLRTTTFAYII